MCRGYLIPERFQVVADEAAQLYIVVYNQDPSWRMNGRGTHL
jgi:hypothetical protein